MGKEKTIAVVYIMWLPYGSAKMNDFIQSYLQFKAGIQHMLFIIFKGRDEAVKIEEDRCNEILLSHNISYHPLFFEGGFDMDAYKFAAKNIDCDFLFFLNTNSSLLADNWLLKMYEAVKPENVGMVSATGSWQSHRSTVFHIYNWKYETKKTLNENFRKYKMLLKALIYYPFVIKKYPNPHLRTNAFMLRRSLFLKLNIEPVSSKFKAYLCESGMNSITNQVLKAGQEILVVDRNGTTYGINDWVKSCTFWIEDQQNLMIADNQTQLYQNADEDYKKFLRFVAWAK